MILTLVLYLQDSSRLWDEILMIESLKLLECTLEIPLDLHTNLNMARNELEFSRTRLEGDECREREVGRL